MLIIVLTVSLGMGKTDWNSLEIHIVKLKGRYKYKSEREEKKKY